MSTVETERPPLKARRSRARSAQRASARDQQGPQVTSLGGCLLRICWMGLGNGALFFLAVHIAMSSAAPSTTDLAFWGTVVLLVAIRYWDVKKLNGLTATHEPATMAHWRRYAVRLPTACFLAWALAHGVAYWAR